MRVIGYMYGSKLGMLLQKTLKKLNIEHYTVYTKDCPDYRSIENINLDDVDILILHPMMFDHRDFHAISKRLESLSSVKGIVLVGIFGGYIRNKLRGIEVKNKTIFIEESIKMTMKSMSFYLARVVNKLENNVIEEYTKTFHSSKSSYVIRSITFQPEHYQSGITILGYFSKFLQHKYPEKHVKVTIEQDDLAVRMIIESPDGETELIERTLNEYGLVMAGDLTPEQTVDDRMAIFELKSQINLMKYQVQQSIEMRDLYKEMATERQQNVIDLQDQVKSLTSAVIKSLLNKPELDLLHKVIDLAKNNLSIHEDLNQLMLIMNADVTPNNPEKVEAILRRINKENPTIIEHLKIFAENATAGVAGNYIFTLIQKLF